MDKKYINFEKIKSNLNKGSFQILDFNYIYKIIKFDELIECQIIDYIPLIEIPKNFEDFKYYINYLEYDDIFNEWILFENLQQTQEIVPKLLKKKPFITRNFDKKIDVHLKKNKTINYIKIDKYLCNTWYYSPFPFGYHYTDILHFCEFCLNFYIEEKFFLHHKNICNFFHPPGNEIYRDDELNMSIFEIDGTINTVYCENLCYLSKLYLGHKLLDFSINTFMFYILTKNDEEGFHFVGYFSKSRDCQKNNLSCILTLPMYQRKGYGKLLINFSYELSKKERKIGTPERPLSSFGENTYYTFWLQKIIEYLKELDSFENLTIDNISNYTYIHKIDIIITLSKYKFLKINKWKEICININKDNLNEIYDKLGKKIIPIIASNIKWIPI